MSIETRNGVDVFNNTKKTIHKHEEMSRDQIVACIQHFYEFINRELQETKSYSEMEDENDSVWMESQENAFDEILIAYERLFSKIICKELI